MLSEKQPAKKRARASDTGKVPATKGAGRKKKTLSLIVTMSIDILLEVNLVDHDEREPCVVSDLLSLSDL